MATAGRQLRRQQVRASLRLPDGARESSTSASAIPDSALRSSRSPHRRGPAGRCCANSCAFRAVRSCRALACHTGYGSIAIRSTSARSRARNGASTRSPACCSPHQQHAMTTTGLPCSAGGTNGAGGATVAEATMVSSSGICAENSRKMRNTSAARSALHHSPPARTVDTGCSLKSNCVTTPSRRRRHAAHERDRRAGRRSTRTDSPFASTTSAPSRLSLASPYLRTSQPIPPPSVNPPMPVVDIMPPVVARPKAPATASKSRHKAPPATVARRWRASTSTVRIPPRSISSVSS